jgi:hypothetical protein
VTVFAATSRYAGIETATIKIDQGPGNDPLSVVYLRRRFLPQPDRLQLLHEHVVEERDRLDNIAFDTIGDPEQFWQIADANAAMNPFTLTATIGRRLRITLPDGFATIGNG